jgi:hypothetical protein
MADKPVDQIKPWTIKAVANRTRELATNSAMREGLTVGQWLEKRLDEWDGAGRPIAATPEATQPGASIGELAQAMATIAAAAGIPVPEHMAKRLLALANDELRAKRRAGRTKPQTGSDLAVMPAGNPILQTQSDQPKRLKRLAENGRGD